jgi:cobalt/nickel transport system permease protein
MARRHLSLFAFLAVGLLAAAALVVFVAPRASSSPDGLEKVAADKGIDTDVREHAFGDGTFADYGVDGVEHAALGTALAGLLGIAVTFVLAAGAVWLVRRRRHPPPSSAVPLGGASPGA